jgi:hypothetical protein
MSGELRYSVHGLEIASEFELPELHPSPDGRAPDVLVQDAPVPREPADPERRWFHVRDDGTAIVRIAGVASYAVRIGSRIDVDPEPDADRVSVRAYLVGPVMRIMLHQRGEIPLHVSAVLLDGRAWAFTAPSGTGKSTLAATLHLHAGLPLVTDDVGVVRPMPDGGPGLLIFPGPAFLKLRTDVMAAVREVAPTPLPDFRGSVKARLPALGGGPSGALPLAGIVRIRRATGRAVEPFLVERLWGADAFAAAASAVHDAAQGAAIGDTAPMFERTAQLARLGRFFVGTMAESRHPASHRRAEEVIASLTRLASSA